MTKAACWIRPSGNQANRAGSDPGAIKTLTEEALKGTLTWSKDVTRTFNAAIKAIDAELSAQLAAVMHHPKFQKLEGTWRGLHYLVMNSETSAQMRLKVMNVSKHELFKDLDKAIEFDQSQMFKKLYENEFGTPGGEPYGALIGDYEFTNHPEDIGLLGQDVERGGGRFLPLHLGRVAGAVRPREFHRVVVPARPGEDLRQRRVYAVEIVPRERGFSLRGLDDAPRLVAPALRGEHEAGRRIQLRGGRR